MRSMASMQASIFRRCAEERMEIFRRTGEFPEYPKVVVGLPGIVAIVRSRKEERNFHLADIIPLAIVTISGFAFAAYMVVTTIINIIARN